MTSSESRRASQVCTTCKARKKRCDKELPTCGYCAERHLGCSYQPSLQLRRTGGVVHDPAFWQTPPLPTIASNHATQPSTDTLVTGPILPTTSLYEFSCTRTGAELGEVLYYEVSRVIESAGLSLHEIGRRFFDGFHRWLPVISPHHFWKAIAEYRYPTSKADFSVLLLAICLIVVRPTSSGQQKHPICLKSLYVTARSYFAQVQAVGVASTPLIQAGLLIAAYEYACQRPDTAYVSIGICTRMSALLDINRSKARRHEEQVGVMSTDQVLEERNIRWGIVIVERLVVSEISDRRHLPVSDFPNDDDHLPVDLVNDQHNDSSVSIATQLDSPLLADVQNSHVEAFARQAQAIAILDKTLHILSNFDTGNSKQQALAGLDERLQSFSALIMREYHTPGRQCGANATVIRTLFLLHQGRLAQSERDARETTDGAYETNSSSLAALNTATRMMATVASHHVEHIANIDMLPICAAYNARLAMKHVESYRGCVDSNSSAILGSLATLEEAFRLRWPTHQSF